MKKDILDWQGIKVGEMELPDDTPEEEWQRKLAAFAEPPPDAQQQQQ